MLVKLMLNNIMVGQELDHLIQICGDPQYISIKMELENH